MYTTVPLELSPFGNLIQSSAEVDEPHGDALQDPSHEYSSPDGTPLDNDW
jgi:hypothetical protein